MRILGPDGKPIETGPSVSEEVKQLVQQAKAIVAEGEPHNALQQMVFAFQSDVSSDLVLDTTCEILLDMMQRANASESFELQIFEKLKIHRSDPAAYQQVGHWFAQNQQFFGLTTAPAAAAPEVRANSTKQMKVQSFKSSGYGASVY